MALIKYGRRAIRPNDLSNVFEEAPCQEDKEN
jgi:hypothetical protein